MKTLQDIKSELLHRCEDMYENYLCRLDNITDNDITDQLIHEYNGFKEACYYLGLDLHENIQRMETKVHAERYSRLNLDEKMVNQELSGLPTQ
jgi:hypothetical protein